MDYAGYLSGKRVVLVGPAASLAGQGKGQWIDEHDVVVRINLASPVPDECKPDVGSRTDVLYHVLFNARLSGAANRRHGPDEVADWKRDGVQWIVTRQEKGHERVRRFLHATRRVRGPIPLVTMDARFKARIRKAVQTNPNTGTLAIAHLLTYNIRELNVTGFDFYSTGYYPGYGGFDSAQAVKGIDGHGAWGQLDELRVPHEQSGQMAYLADLAREDARLTFDAVAAARLGIAKIEPAVVALVPMKGQSERVPGKNTRDLCGKPLLFWTLHALHRASRVSQVVVDTDSEEIAELVRQYHPRTTVLMRPDDLRGDMVTGNPLTEWEMTQVEGEHFLQTHVTNPLLTPETIDAAVDAYFATPRKYDSLFAVTEHYFRLFDRDTKPVNHDPAVLQRSQDLEPLYEDNSNLYVFSRKSFATAGGRIGRKPQMFRMSKYESVDIDWPEDFHMAEALMSWRLSHA